MQEQRALGAALAVDQLELVEGVVVGEQPPAVPGERGSDDESELVDQPRAEQGAREPDAAVDPDVPARLVLQVVDVGVDGRRDQRAVRPLLTRLGRGDDVFRTPLTKVANGSMSDVGQYPTQ